MSLLSRSILATLALCLCHQQVLAQGSAASAAVVALPSTLTPENLTRHFASADVGGKIAVIQQIVLMERDHSAGTQSRSSAIYGEQRLKFLGIIFGALGDDEFKVSAEATRTLTKLNYRTDAGSGGFDKVRRALLRRTSVPGNDNDSGPHIAYALVANALSEQPEKALSDYFNNGGLDLAMDLTIAQAATVLYDMKLRKSDRGAARYRQILLFLLHSSDPTLRSFASNGLRPRGNGSRFKDSQLTEEELAPIVNDLAGTDRARHISALRTIGDQRRNQFPIVAVGELARAVPLVVEIIMNTKDKTTLKATTQFFARTRVKDEMAMAVLADLLRHPDKEIRDVADTAISMSGFPDGSSSGLRELAAVAGNVNDLDAAARAARQLSYKTRAAPRYWRLYEALIRALAAHENAAAKNADSPEAKSIRDLLMVAIEFYSRCLGFKEEDGTHLGTANTVAALAALATHAVHSAESVKQAAAIGQNIIVSRGDRDTRVAARTAKPKPQKPEASTPVQEETLNAEVQDEAADFATQGLILPFAAAAADDDDREEASVADADATASEDTDAMNDPEAAAETEVSGSPNPAAARLEVQLQLIKKLHPSHISRSVEHYRSALEAVDALKISFGVAQNNGRFAATYTKLCEVLAANDRLRVRQVARYRWDRIDVVEAQIVELLHQVARSAYKLKPTSFDPVVNATELRAQRVVLYRYIESRSDTVAIAAMFGVRFLMPGERFYRALKARLESSPSTAFIEASRETLVFIKKRHKSARAAAFLDEHQAIFDGPVVDPQESTEAVATVDVTAADIAASDSAEDEALAELAAAAGIEDAVVATGTAPAQPAGALNGSARAVDLFTLFMDDSAEPVKRVAAGFHLLRYTEKHALSMAQLGDMADRLVQRKFPNEEFEIVAAECLYRNTETIRQNAVGTSRSYMRIAAALMSAEKQTNVKTKALLEGVAEILEMPGNATAVRARVATICEMSW